MDLHLATSCAPQTNKRLQSSSISPVSVTAALERTGIVPSPTLKSHKQHHVNVSEVHFLLRLVVCPLSDCPPLLVLSSFLCSFRRVLCCFNSQNGRLGTMRLRGHLSTAAATALCTLHSALSTDGQSGQRPKPGPCHYHPHYARCCFSSSSHFYHYRKRANGQL